MIVVLALPVLLASAPVHVLAIEDYGYVPGFAAQPSAAVDSVPARQDTTVWTLGELKSILATESGMRDTDGRTWRSHKSGKVAMLCSLVFPGLGQMYNERPLKAAIAMGAETFYLSLVWLNQRYARREEQKRDSYPRDSYQWAQHDLWAGEYKERSIDWVWWSAGALLVIVLDAYIDAHLSDMKFKVESEARGDGTGVALVVPF